MPGMTRRPTPPQATDLLTHKKRAAIVHQTVVVMQEDVETVAMLQMSLNYPDVYIVQGSAKTRDDLLKIAYLATAVCEGIAFFCARQGLQGNRLTRDATGHSHHRGQRTRYGQRR